MIEVLFVGKTDIKCVNHSEVAAIPIFIYFLALNCNENPIMKPTISKIIISILLYHEIMKVWSGDSIHVIHDPDVIASDLNRIIGI